MTEEKSMINHGRNVALFRGANNYKQDTLAKLLGGTWTQRKVSELEAQEKIDEAILAELSPVLGVSVQILQNFKTDESSHYFYNYFSDHASIQAQAITNPSGTINFNAVDKIVELYERLVIAEKEKAETAKQK